MSRHRPIENVAPTPVQHQQAEFPAFGIITKPDRQPFADLGAVIELILLRPLRGANIDTTMLIMIGAWIAMQNTEQLVWSGIAKSINSTELNVMRNTASERGSMPNRLRRFGFQDLASDLVL